jgi:hypothetical protein
MGQLKFKPCGKCITGTYQKQAVSPPGAYQTEGVSRCNLSDIPCTNGGSTERKLGAGKAPGEASVLCSECGKFIKWLTSGEVAKINTQNQGGL